MAFDRRVEVQRQIEKWRWTEGQRQIEKWRWGTKNYEEKQSNDVSKGTKQEEEHEEEHEEEEKKEEKQEGQTCFRSLAYENVL